MKYTFIIFFILLVRLIFRLFRFRFFRIWSGSFTFLIVRSMMLVRLKMWMTWMIWFSPFSVISVDRALIEIIVVFHLLFTYLFTLLHKNTTFTESRLSISAANRWFRSDARAGVAITSFEFCQNLSEVKIWGIFQSKNYQFWRAIFHEFGKSIMKGRLWSWWHSYSTCIIKSHNSRNIEFKIFFIFKRKRSVV